MLCVVFEIDTTEVEGLGHSASLVKVQVPCWLPPQAMARVQSESSGPQQRLVTHFGVDSETMRNPSESGELSLFEMCKCVVHVPDVPGHFVCWSHGKG